MNDRTVNKQANEWIKGQKQLKQVNEQRNECDRMKEQINKQMNKWTNKQINDDWMKKQHKETI